MSRLMLNLHEASHLGIYTTDEAALTRVELDTLWSEDLHRPSSVASFELAGRATQISNEELRPRETYV